MKPREAADEENETPVRPSSQTEQVVRSTLALLHPEIAALVAFIGSEPELGYQERKAAARIASLLESRGHRCDVGIAGMATALRVRKGQGHPCFCLLAEYDALPDIGHACGHNVIAGAAVGAYLALAETWSEGTLELLGCPAEESAVDGSGGKIRLIDGGAFDAADAAIMIHPFDRNLIATYGSLAVRGVDFEFRGRSAHAAASPDQGINALDAAVQAYCAISMLRQQIPSNARVHGIIRHGGQAANIIPDFASLRYRIRAPKAIALEQLFQRVLRCAEGAALSSGCSFQWAEFNPMYMEQVQNPELVRIGNGVLRDLGLEMAPDDPSAIYGSSDFGNVSHRVPALEILIQVAPGGTPLHSTEFAAEATSPAAGEKAVLGALAIALTALRASESSAFRLQR